MEVKIVPNKPLKPNLSTLTFEGRPLDLAIGSTSFVLACGAFFIPSIPHRAIACTVFGLLAFAIFMLYSSKTFRWQEYYENHKKEVDAIFTTSSWQTKIANDIDSQTGKTRYLSKSLVDEIRELCDGMLQVYKQQEKIKRKEAWNKALEPPKQESTITDEDKWVKKLAHNPIEEELF